MAGAHPPSAGLSDSDMNGTIDLGIQRDVCTDYVQAHSLLRTYIVTVQPAYMVHTDSVRLVAWPGWLWYCGSTRLWTATQLSGDSVDSVVLLVIP